VLTGLWPEPSERLRIGGRGRGVGELIALGEELRGAALRGRGIGADDMVRVERLSALALRALHLPSAASKQTLPSLAEYLASIKHSDAE
jgi:hypothetical protein